MIEDKLDYSTRIRGPIFQDNSRRIALSIAQKSKKRSNQQDKNASHNRMQ